MRLMGKLDKTNVLFAEMNFEGSRRTLILNKPRILDRIHHISKSESLALLQEQVYRLRADLADYEADKAKLFNIATNGDTLTITEKYLLGELRQIVEARTLERSKYYLRRLAKAISEKRTNNLNDLDLNRWKEHSDIITDSLWILQKRDSSGVHSADYWGNFIPQIPQQMMKRYTKAGEWVLDTFAGCGTTQIEAQRLGRNSIGIELQAPVVEAANKLIRSEPNRFRTINEVVQGDSAEIDFAALLSRYSCKSVQLLIMHPPYFDIIKFSDDPRDLSNAPTVEAFLAKMNTIVANASRVLDSGRYLALVIGDKYSKGEWIPLGFLTMQEVLKTAYTLKSIIVKNFEETSGKRNQKELWRYRALVGGFYIFKHEYVFLFRKK